MPKPGPRRLLQQTHELIENNRHLCKRSRRAIEESKRLAIHSPEPMSRSTEGRKNPLKNPPDITRNRENYDSNHVHRSRVVVRLITDRLTAGART